MQDCTSVGVSVELLLWALGSGRGLTATWRHDCPLVTQVCQVVPHGYSHYGNAATETFPQPNVSICSS
jgi:hypothetical protein